MFLGVLWSVSSGISAPRTVLAELFTNTGCSPCGEANPALDEIFNRHPEILAVVRYHVNWPYPYDPFYLINPSENLARVHYYGVGSVPNLRIDGLINGGYLYENWEPLILERAQIPSSVLLTLSVSMDTLLLTGTVTARIEAESPVLSSKLHLRFVLVEDDVFYEASNGETLHQQVMRDMIPDSLGIPIPPLPAGQVIVDTQIFQVDSSWVVQNLEMVAFLQDDSTLEVHQAARAFALPLPRIRFHHYVLQDGNDHMPEPGESVELSLYVVNEGRAPAENLQIALGSDDPYLAVTPEVLPFGTLEVGEIGTSSQPFLLTLSSSMPDSYGTWIHFTAFTASDTVSRDSFFFLVDLTPGLWDNGEAGESLWTRYGGYGIWHLTDHRAFSPSHSWYSGIEGAWYYYNDADLSMESPYFLVGPSASLQFRQWYALQTNEDVGRVEVSQNGRTWLLLDEMTGNSGGWTAVQYDLSPYTGSPLKIRFRMITDASVAWEGWYIDDIGVVPLEVQETHPLHPTLELGTFSGITSSRPRLLLHHPLPGLYRVSIYLTNGYRSHSFSFQIPNNTDQWAYSVPMEGFPVSGVYFVQILGPQGQLFVLPMVYLKTGKESDP